MSVSSRSLHPDEKFKAGKLGGALSKAGLGIAAVFLGISIILSIAGSADLTAGHESKWARFFYSYVIAWTYIFTICLGCQWLVLLHHLTRSRWSTVVRRVAEAVSCAFPIVFIAGLGFIIPLLAGYKDLY